MMRLGPLSLWLLISGIPGHAFAGPDSQEEESRRLRDELVKARLENLELKLRLARLQPKPDEEIKILEEALDTDLPEVVAAAFRELSGLPEGRRQGAVPAVLKRFRSGKESFRREAVLFLGRISAPEAESTILASAADPAPAVRKAVAGALKNATDRAAAETLLALFRDPSAEVRIAALDALGVARREGAVGPLASALATEKDPLILEKLVDVLGALGAAEATDGLLRLLASSSREAIRWSCINSLGKIGDPQAGPRLLPYMEPTQPLDVRQVTIESLGKLKETAALPRLAEVLRREPHEKLRQAAALAFGLMAGAGSIDEVLLPAYLQEEADAVRRALWTSMLGLAGEGFASNEKLALAFLNAGRRAEADQICTRLHASKPEGELRGRRLVLEESVARSLFEASDFRAALPHCRQVAALSPDRVDAVRRVASCQRELQELDGCLRTLSDLRDPEPLIEEAWHQLQSAPGDDRRRALEGLLRSAAARLVEPLAGKDEAARKSSLEAIRRLGRKILPSLAAELEEGPKLPGAVLEAGSVITGIPNDPADAGKSKAGAWRTWLEANRVK